MPVGKKLDLTPRPQDLDPIEIASRDEIAALQLQRLKSLDTSTTTSRTIAAPSTPPAFIPTT